jgi:hypothetical protein
VDKDFIAAIREFLKKQATLEASGVALTPVDIEEFFRTKTGGRYGYKDAQEFLGSIDTDIGPRNLLRSAAQGLAMNFGDEILGAINPAAGEEMRLREDLFRQEHPIADLAAGFAGGLVVPGGAGAAAARGARTVGRAIAAGAGVGAASGTVAGFGAGEGLQDRTNKATVGGVAGLAVGAGLPLVVGGLRAAVSPATRANRRLQRAIDRSGGPAALSARAQEFQAAGRGDEVMLGDLSDEMRLATDFAANNSDEALVQVARQVRDRQADASQRILEDVRQTTGTADAPLIQDKLAKGTARWARGPEGYGGLRASNPIVPEAPFIQELLPYLQQPRVKDTLRRVQLDGLIGNTPDNSPASFQMLQTLKERVGDQASAAFARSEGQLGADLREVEEQVAGFLERYVPNYSAVTRQYRTRKGLERAVELGAEWFDAEDTRGLRRVLNGLTPQERTLFQRGMVSRLIAKLRSAQTNRDEAKRLMDASPALQEKLRIVFGSEERFLAFMRNVELEAELAQMRGPISGSATARRLQSSGFDPLELGLEVVERPVSSVAQLLAKMGKGSVARRTAGEMTGPLTTQGTPAIQDYLRRLQGRPATVPPWASGIVPGAASSLWQ